MRVCHCINMWEFRAVLISMMLPIFLVCSLAALLEGVPIDTAVNELNQVQQSSAKIGKARPSPLAITVEDSEFIASWPDRRLLDYLGEVSGLAFCPAGFLYIFHRADAEMNEKSFDSKNRYMRIQDGPIKESTIVKLNNRIDEPKVVGAFGSNLFYLPHGLSVNKEYMVATDVATHQVVRIPHNSNTPDLVIGEKFVPGDDASHFCKPTHAVIASDGSIFVADGYCNSRIVKFDKSGKFQTQFGDKKDQSGLSIPHHLVLIESKDVVCVADRENMRVQCYSAGIKDKKNTGKFVRSISDERFGPIYAVGFNNLNNMMYIVSGMMDENDRSRVFIYNWEFDKLTGTLDYSGSNGFGIAHTIDVCPKGHCVVVGGLTKECSTDAATCMESGNDSEEYQLRNIWLFSLIDEKLELE